MSVILCVESSSLFFADLESFDNKNLPEMNITSLIYEKTKFSL